MIEPYAILNPMGKYYKFLFHSQDFASALEFVKKWASQHGWNIKRQRQREMPKHGLIEISAWLI